MSRNNRSIIAQIRIGILPLLIETGRFRNISVENRLCQVCNTQLIEDEIHFLCTCPEYTNIRNEMYHSIIVKHNGFDLLSDQDKFIYIMKNEWKSLGIYLSKAWQIRTNKLYK